MKQAIALIVLLLTASASAQTKVVLMEKLTGTWCPPCPRGEVFARDIRTAHPGQVLVVSIHNNDTMSIPGEDYGDSTQLSFLPAANIDRVFIERPTADWGWTVNSRLASQPIGTISVGRTFDPLTRQMDINVTADFITTPPAGDYRLGAIIVEDGVHGTHEEFEQANFYAGAPPGTLPGFEELPNPVPAEDMVYDHVARALLDLYSGVPGSVGSTPQAGQSFSQSFSYVIPAEFNEEYVRAYGVLLNASTGAVLNAAASPYAVGDLNTRPFFLPLDSVRGIVGDTLRYVIDCHDTDIGNLTVTAIANLPSWASLTMLDDNSALLSGVPTTGGTHVITLEVSDGSYQRTTDLNVEVVAPYDPWIPVGPPQFTPDTTWGYLATAVDVTTNAVYAAHVAQSNKVKVYKKINANWNAVGNQIPGFDPGYYVDLAVEPTSGEPWVVFRDNGYSCKVMRYTGTNWTQVGGSVSGAQQANIAFSNMGTAYVSSWTSSATIRVHEWDGNNWIALGSAYPLFPVPGWMSNDGLFTPQLAILPSGAPIVAFVHKDAANNRRTYVAEWDGNAWGLMGGGAPSTALTTFSVDFPHRIAVDGNGTVHLAVNVASGVEVFKFDGTAWAMTGSFQTPTPRLFDLHATPNGWMYLAWKDEFGRLSCRMYDGTGWSSIGDHFSEPVGNDIELFAYANGYPGVLYKSPVPGSKPIAERYLSIGLTTPAAPETLPYAYPVPTRDVLYIEHAQGSNGWAVVHDATGRTVVRLPVQQNAVDVSGVEPGAYVLCVEGGRTVRFVKE